MPTIDVVITVVRGNSYKCDDCLDSSGASLIVLDPKLSAFERTAQMFRSWSELDRTDWVMKLDDDTWLSTPNLARHVYEQSMPAAARHQTDRLGGSSEVEDAQDSLDQPNLAGEPAATSTRGTGTPSAMLLSLAPPPPSHLRDSCRAGAANT